MSPAQSPGSTGGAGDSRECQAARFVVNRPTSPKTVRGTLIADRPRMFSTNAASRQVPQGRYVATTSRSVGTAQSDGTKVGCTGQPVAPGLAQRTGQGPSEVSGLGMVVGVAEESTSLVASSAAELRTARGRFSVVMNWKRGSGV